MKVYIVSDGTHGNIGVTKNDIPTVINFLLRNLWLSDNTRIWSEKLRSWTSVSAYFGEHWREVMLTWDVDTFREYFDEVFYIEEYEVYSMN